MSTHATSMEPFDGLDQQAMRALRITAAAASEKESGIGVSNIGAFDEMRQLFGPAQRVLEVRFGFVPQPGYRRCHRG